MKLHVQHRHDQRLPSFTALIASEFELLRATLHIDEARVLIERRLECSPAFRITAHLVTPGPDIRAEGIDHTLHAALQKLIANLSGRIQSRHAKRTRRLRSNIQEPVIRRGAPTVRVA